MSCDHSNTCTCGCCEGVDVSTPFRIDNAAGLEKLSFRIGIHGAFKASMLAGISASDLLKDWTSRVDDDPGIALVDAWATVLDVLTFYQERIIQEGFLRTSIERLSLVELARHISYRPKPGVAAGTWLSFFLDESPSAVTEATIPIGMKVQSVPGQEETAQKFETIEEITARTKWNALQPLLTETQALAKGCTSMYVEGTGLQIQMGDTIVIIGSERLSYTGSERWDLRSVTSVVEDQSANLTLINWREGLGHENPYTSPGSSAEVYVFRQRASLFGYNAPDPRLFDSEVSVSIGYTAGNSEWNNFEISDPEKGIIYLDAVYPKIINDSWIALVKPKYAELYKVITSIPASQKKYGLNAKTSQLELDSAEHLSWFGLRNTMVLAQSEKLTLAQAPILAPVTGSRIDFQDACDDFEVGQKLILSGEPVRYLQVTERSKILRTGTKEYTENTSLYLITADNTIITLATDDILAVTGVPEALSNGNVKWPVNLNGITGTVEAGAYDVVPYKEEMNTGTVQVATSLNQDEVVSELIEIKTIGTNYIELLSAMQYGYWRSTVKINANVAQATHGESKKEILGSGNGALAFQKFKLKQKPLTYISSDNTTGSESTLQIKVDDITWHETSTFYGKGPQERIFITRMEDDGTVYVQFGDGITGARLPSGNDNVIADYRVGIGLDALVDSSQISILLTPQLGVKSVNNPLPATGAEDPEVIEDVRSNAPLTVLNMDRIVSILDYQYFANAFAGIGKARADLLWKGENRILHLTVASADKGEIDSTLKTNLTSAIDGARHDLFPVVITSFKEIKFDVSAAVMIASDYTAESVLEEITAKLVEEYAFESRNFGQSIHPSEIISIIHDIDGVVAVKLLLLGGQDPFATEHYRLQSEIARWSGNTILPAELLIIDEDQITLTTWVDEN